MSEPTDIDGEIRAMHNGYLVEESRVLQAEVKRLQARVEELEKG